MAKAVDIPKDAMVKSNSQTSTNEQQYSQGMRRYMTFLAVVQGFAVMINLNAVFMLSGMASRALEVEPFSGLVVFVLELMACTVNTFLFWMNPVKPWLTVVVSYLQAAAYIFQIIVIRFMTGTNGKIMYLVGTAVCGAIFGCNSMTSFAFVAFGPTNHLGSLSFGFAVGGVVPFFFSTVIQFTFFADNTIESTKNMMYSFMGFVAIVSAICALNLTIYLNNKDIKRHYTQIDVDGITAVRCTFRSAAKGLKYTWKIVLVDFISYINLLSFYPTILPFTMRISLKYKIMIVGIFNICDTLGRGIAVFVNPKWLPCNTLNRVIILAICNMGTTAFLICSTIYYETFIGHIAVIVIGFITLGVVGGYCNSYSDKAIGEHVPKHLDNDTVVSTTNVFKIIVSVFCAIGSLIATFMVRIFPEPVVEAAAEKVADAAGDVSEAAAKVAEAVVKAAEVATSVAGAAVSAATGAGAPAAAAAAAAAS